MERVRSGEVVDETLGEAVDAWTREDCRGAVALAEAAALAMSYEIASAGLSGPGEDAETDLRSTYRALERVRGALRPVGACPEDSGVGAAIVEVALPEELRRRMPKGRGFVMGPLRIIFEPHEGPPHGHISVSHPSRYPTWEEIRLAVAAPGGEQPNLWAWVPKPERDSVSYTIHLYVLPPKEFLG